MARVVIEHLTKVFPGPRSEDVRALSGLTFAAEDRELLVIIGPSGCGKTTALRLIAGLDEPTSGTIAIDGQIVNRIPPKDRDVAMVFQNPALYPHMSVYDNMAFGLSLRGYLRQEIERRVQETAALLGLSDYLNRRPMALSGGQRQRVALGRALVRRPKVLLLDEPLSNLDPQLRVRMRQEIATLHRQLAMTLIYVTHDQTEAMTLGSRVAVMAEGRLQQLGPPLELYRHPANLFVAGFLGSPTMNFIEGALLQKDGCFHFQMKAGQEARAAKTIVFRPDDRLAARLTPYLGKRLILGLRPEHIAWASTSAAPEAPGLKAVVENIEPLGAETNLYLRSEEGQLFVARVSGGLPVRISDTIQVVLEMRNAHFFDADSQLAIT
ncbi:MAG TPA: ABC transporter ATP-binding protein [Clostridia bacterium]|nr:ABC transporter ATP-binding protein [Clostridia bacterium]